MRIRPISPDLLVTELTGRLADAATAPRAPPPGPRGCGWRWTAPPPPAPDELAAALVDPLRARGRPVLHVRATDFLRPASLRFELGRTNPDSFYEGWVDEAGLRREVLDPAGPGGTRPAAPVALGRRRRPGQPRPLRRPGARRRRPGQRLAAARRRPALRRRPSTWSCPRRRCAGAPNRPSSGRCRPSTGTPRRSSRRASPTWWYAPTTPAARRSWSPAETTDNNREFVGLPG